MEDSLKIVFIFILVFNGLAALAKPSDDFAELERQRQERYAKVKSEAEDLNFARRILNGLQIDLRLLKEEWERIQGDCGGGALEGRAELCSDEIKLLCQSTEQNIGRLKDVRHSRAYQDHQRQPRYDSLGLDRTVQRALEQLTRFQNNCEIRREEMGAFVVKARVNKVHGQMADETKRRQLAVTCQMLPDNLSSRLTRAELLQHQAELESDGHLLLKSELMVQEVRQIVRTMKSQCPQADLKDVTGRAARLESQQADAKLLSRLGEQACGKLKQADAEMRSICRARDFNPGTLYSIHLELKRQARK